MVKSPAMRKITGLCLLAGATLLGGCDDDASGGKELFPPKPECSGADIVAFQGMPTQVISKLEIGAASDGFDLDGDGDPDNKLAAVASLAKSAIDDSFKNYSIVIPIEFFDLMSGGADECVKFAIYLGAYVTDADADGKKAFIDKGDCNDTLADGAAIKPGATEDETNLVDDDCDGKADENAQNVASTNTTDADGDGFSPATGDCDDRVGKGAALKPGGVEICGDGLDNDCDGVADRSVDGSGNVTACSPYDPGKADIYLDKLSFVQGTTNQPIITFRDGTISASGELLAGPSLFSVAIPVTDGITLDLKISGATITGQVSGSGPTMTIKNGHLGGVIDAKTADTIRGLTVEQIGLLPENSLLDATFANLLGPLLALPKAAKKVTDKYTGCRTPDIDVDGDGLEAFCDTDPNDEIKVVDVCIDGDGTEVKDMPGMECSSAQKNGKNRFPDGISVELNFETVSVKSIKPPRT